MRLVSKLESYGITDFLKNRTQRVSVNGHVSKWSDVSSGISQGSVFGPVLYVVFINDLPDVVHSMVRIFADDTKMFGKVATKADRDTLQKHRQSCQVVRGLAAEV